jgi:hypothetical protein
MAARDEPWWISFFAGAWGEQQQAGYPPERTNAEIDFILRSLTEVGYEAGADLSCACGGPGPLSAAMRNPEGGRYRWVST